MSHKPIVINKISLSFDNKFCFTDFSAQIFYKNKIGIIGNNGTGKSSLLKLLKEEITPNAGNIKMPEDVKIGYIPQTIEDKNNLSGGEKFLKSLSSLMGQNINLLLLDEPTNHLDKKNKKALIKMLSRFPHTLIVVSHDKNLLKNCVETIWNIEEGKINIFSGHYEDYLHEQQINRNKNLSNFINLKKEQKSIRSSLQFENERASKKNIKNRNEKDRTLKNKMKETASNTTGKNKKKILEQKKTIDEELENYKKIEIIKPTFELLSKNISSSKVLVSVVNGSIKYQNSDIILKNIYLLINSNDRLLISGENGSGKTTLIKAILDDPNIIKTGEWLIFKKELIGYLDQNYDNLNPNESVLNSIKKLQTDISEPEIRKVLSTFLFRTNVEVNTLVKNLSGGEKARLSLAHIAIKTPALLILDEITNNIDINTKNHVIEVLNQYPGALIIISHDDEFISKIAMNKVYEI